MQPETGARLVERLRRVVAGEPEPYAPFEIAAARYRDPAHFARELAAIRRAPQIVTTSAALAPGACVPIDLPAPHAERTTAASIVLVRGPDNVVRAFPNACRHRGTRLVDAPCTAKAMVCPYHGWTYDLTGALLHVPHDEAFAGVALGKRSLPELPVAERHGLVWVGGTGAQVDAHLGPFAGELAALDFASHVPFRTTRVERACNWKLVIEAFLDGYHIRVLHRDSIYRFFVDAASVAEPVGPHICAMTARRTLRERTGAPLRELTTPSYYLFPATIVIAHPDFISLITLEPLAPDRTAYHHVMVVPAARAGETEHWERSWHLIEETVFQREDLWVCEQAQRGLASGATDALLFGSLEAPARWFHDAIDRALAAASGPPSG